MGELCLLVDEVDVVDVVDAVDVPTGEAVDEFGAVG
jgi:hypothetical protein